MLQCNDGQDGTEEMHIRVYNDTNFISGHEYEANIVGTAESSGGSYFWRKVVPKN